MKTAIVTDVRELLKAGARMYEVGKTYNINNLKICIQKLSYVENGKILDEFKFSIYDNQHKFTVDGYAVDVEESDSYAIDVYDTTDDNALNAHDRECPAQYDSCGGCAVDCDIKIFDATWKRMEDFEKAILEVLFGANGIIIPF